MRNIATNVASGDSKFILHFDRNLLASTIYHLISFSELNLQISVNNLCYQKWGDEKINYKQVKK